MWLYPPHKGSYDDNCQWPMNIPFRCIKTFCLLIHGSSKVLLTMECISNRRTFYHFKNLILTALVGLVLTLLNAWCSERQHACNNVCCILFSPHSCRDWRALIEHRKKTYWWKRKPSIRTLVNFILLFIWVIYIAGRLTNELITNIELITHLMQWEQDDYCNIKGSIQDNLHCIIFIVMIVIGFLQKFYFQSSPLSRRFRQEENEK